MMGWASLAAPEGDRLLYWCSRTRDPRFELQLVAARIWKPERDVLLPVGTEHAKSFVEVDRPWLAS
jgi:hypothetical protein